MSTPLIDRIVQTWITINPVAGYTSGAATELTDLLFETEERVMQLQQEIASIASLLGDLTDPMLRATAEAVLKALATQLELARPSGAGPSGTGAGGVYAAADGVFYITLKRDHDKPWVAQYLELANEMVEFETVRWRAGCYTVEERKECLDTVTYFRGTLDAIDAANSSLGPATDKIRASLEAYQELFYSAELASDDFEVLWKAFEEGDRAMGPIKAKGYPGTLDDYYTLGMTLEQVEDAAKAWMQIDMPVTTDLALRMGAILGLAENASLQEVWDAMSAKYSKDFSVELMEKVLKACNDYGQKHILHFTKQDVVKFEATPPYLVNLVTGGEDFAVDYLTDKPFSQLYLTASKNSSLLTMINILVHEASHGYNFVMSARQAPSPLLNLNTSLEVPMTEGQAFYREYQYYAAAAALLDKQALDPEELAYLQLYGDSKEEQRTAVLGAQLETYIWRVVRYIRALCDVRVNGGKQTYTEFLRWASEATGLSTKTLHGECFTFLASPGYAPCYAIGGAFYGDLSTQGYKHGVDEAAFNTKASAMGFRSWPEDIRQMTAIARGEV